MIIVMPTIRNSRQTTRYKPREWDESPWAFAGKDLDDTVEDKTSGDTIGDAVAQRHENTGKECRNCLVQISPVNLFERGHHHDADSDQSGSCGCEGNRADKGCKKRGKSKADRDDDGSQTGASSCANAGRAFYKRGRIRSSDQSADRSSRSVREKRLIQLGMKSAFVSMAFSSSALKMPLRRPVPMKVPIVSNVSEMLKEKMVIKTNGSLDISVNRLPIPPSLKIARKVVGNA